MEVAITKNTAELERLEGIITRNLQSFYEVGRALMEIRDRGYYREVLGFDTFEAYCKAKWDFTGRYARSLMASTGVIDNLTGTIVPPTTESQARPLARLEPQQQREAWAKAVESAPDGKVTAAHVYKIVKGLTNKPTDPAPSREPQEPSDAMAFAVMVISQLERIRPKDPKREQALHRVITKIVSMLPEQEKTKPRKGIIKQEPVSPDFQRAFDQMDIELRNARALKWKSTSHEGAIELAQILLTMAEQ